MQPMMRSRLGSILCGSCARFDGEIGHMVAPDRTGMSRSVVAWAIALSLIVSVVPRADAAPTRGVLVLPMAYEGLPEATLKALNRALRAEAKRSLKSKLLPTPALALPDLQVAAGCAGASVTCLGKIGRILRATWVVQAQIRGSAQKLRVQIQWVDTRNGKAGSADLSMQNVDADSVTEFRWRLARAFGRDPGPLTGAINLRTVSKSGTLSGAELLVDDRPVSAIALKTLAPGEHRIEVRQRGFETFIWMGKVRGGRTTHVAVDFRPKTAAPAVASTPAIPTPPIATARPDDSASPAPEPAPSLGGPEAAPPAGVQGTRGPDTAPRLVYTWIFGAGALVAAGAGTVLAVQTRKLDQDTKDDTPLFCAESTDPDWNSDTCRKGRSRQTAQFVTWGLVGALGVGAVVAFFLEDGPSVLSGDDDVALGFGPTSGGVAGSLRVRF